MFILKVNIIHSFQRACCFKAVCSPQLNVDKEQEQEPPRSSLGHRWLERENVCDITKKPFKKLCPKSVGLASVS